MDATTQEENKRIARRVPEDIATQGNLDLISEIYAPTVTDHSPLGDIEGIEAVRKQMSAFLGAFSDFSASVDDIIAEGDIVAMRVTLSGKHDGEFIGIPPTGKRFEASNMVFTRVVDGKIAERWVLPDMLGIFHQLDVIESPMER